MLDLILGTFAAYQAQREICEAADMLRFRLLRDFPSKSRDHLETAETAMMDLSMMVRA